MDEQTNVSPQIEDHRHLTHGLAAVVAFLVGLFTGHTDPKPTPVVDADHGLVIVASTALDRGDDYWAAHVEPERWRPPHLVLVSHDHGEITPCGHAGADSGPFYCPGNERIYLDVDFLQAINGELARAYVVAHELGHHVQKMLNQLRPAADSVTLELQADCYAGMWMRDEQAKGHLDTGDIAAALAEASAVGDDRLCPTCRSEQWTHGSSEQRVAKLQEGLRGGPCM